MSKLTNVDIPIDSNHNTTLSFLLLQTHLQQDGMNAYIQQIDGVLYDLYNQVTEIQKDR